MALTPELCRAGRALLTWTQRDLADRAQTAVSTIADFERGKRSPIAQSIAALETALKEGGLSFTGGRAELSAEIGGFAHLDGGRSIPLITSADLIGWAELYDSVAGLPMLIAMLVRASAGADAVLRFPADEGVREPGWDGICESPRSADYVPAGRSRWELSANKRPQAKAAGDYKKRKSERERGWREATTYIAVMLRAWPDKEDWADERRADGVFKDVRILDVHDLVTWLAMHPTIADWLAVRLKKRSISGVTSLDEGWRRWAFATTPPLTERIVLAGRDQEQADVLAWLRSPATVLHVQAAEREEAIAFLYAAIRQLPEAYRETYRTHTLIAETDTAVREISVAMKPLIIVMNGSDLGLAASTAQAGHHVYAVHGPETQLENGISLRDARRVDLVDALEDPIDGMGQKPDVARALASRAGGSVASLRRILSEATTMPAWMRSVSRGTVNAAFFAGAWDEHAPVDKEIIARLAQRPFEDVSGELASVMAAVGSPLRRSLSKVQVVSVQDLWSALAPRMNDGDIEAYLACARDVLLHVDPRFYDNDRAKRITFGDRPQIATKELRRGLVEALNVMASLQERAKNVTHLEGRITGFVSALLDDADAPRWWSLRDLLPLLAEAAPQEFLDAVIVSVKRDDAPIAVLLQPDGDGFFARDYISDLTTALERLAWIPTYFDDAITALAELARKDPKESRHGNRPAETLRQIFLMWHPQTHASLEARMTTLARVRDVYRVVAWPLFISLLPKYGSDAASYSSKPVWRPLQPEEASSLRPQSPPSKNPYIVVYEWLLGMTGENITRWKQLLESLTGLTPDQQSRATEGVLAFARTLEGHDDRVAVRDVMRELLHRHREFGQAPWAMPESVLEPLETAFDLLTPSSVIERERWVFANQPAPPDPAASHDLDVINAHNAAHRHRVARELLSTDDLDELFAMATAVDNPVLLGTALVDVDIDGALRDALIERGAQSSATHHTEFARGIVLAGIPKYGAAWGASTVRVGIAAGWPSSALVAVLQGMPQDKDTFALAREAGHEVEQYYWERTPWMWFIHSDPLAIVSAVEAKLRVSRPIEAVSLIGQTGPKGFSSELLLRTMSEASVQFRSDVRENDSSMLSHYCGLILDELTADESVDRNAVIRLEWTYFGLLQTSGRDATLLEAALAQHPDFFIELVSAVYRGDDDADDEPDAQKRVVAGQSYALLEEWSIVPGSAADGTIDADGLSAWVKKARELAVAAKRVDIVDQQIGAILSAAQAEPNGDWPPLPVRELLERVRSKELELGFRTGTRNRRGVTTRGPLDGGEQERDLKSHYEMLEKRFRNAYPKTANVLKAIAASYKVDALYMDQLADAVDRMI